MSWRFNKTRKNRRKMTGGATGAAPTPAPAATAALGYGPPDRAVGNPPAPAATAALGYGPPDRAVGNPPAPAAVVSSGAGAARLSQVTTSTSVPAYAVALGVTQTNWNMHASLRADIARSGPPIDVSSPSGTLPAAAVAAIPPGPNGPWQISTRTKYSLQPQNEQCPPGWVNLYNGESFCGQAVADTNGTCPPGGWVYNPGITACMSPNLLVFDRGDHVPPGAIVSSGAAAQRLADPVGASAADQRITASAAALNERRTASAAARTASAAALNERRTASAAARTASAAALDQRRTASAAEQSVSAAQASIMPPYAVALGISQDTWNDAIYMRSMGAKSAEPIHPTSNGTLPQERIASLPPGPLGPWQLSQTVAYAVNGQRSRGGVSCPPGFISLGMIDGVNSACVQVINPDSNGTCPSGWEYDQHSTVCKIPGVGSTLLNNPMFAPSGAAPAPISSGALPPPPVTPANINAVRTLVTSLKDDPTTSSTLTTMRTTAMNAVFAPTVMSQLTSTLVSILQDPGIQASATNAGTQIYNLLSNALLNNPTVADQLITNLTPLLQNPAIKGAIQNALNLIQ